LLAIAGAALLVVAFFLPWMDGSAEFAARDFSGFDLARLVRNFEIATSGDNDRLRLTAAVLYGVPALAVNAGVFAIVPQLRAWARAAMAVGAVYAFVVLVGIGVLATGSGTELERVMGPAMIGYYVSLVGAFMMAAAAALQLRR